MQTINVPPKMEGWLIYRPNRVIEEIIEKLSHAYEIISPISQNDVADIISIQRKLDSLLEKRGLTCNFKTVDGYTWALAAEFAAHIGFPPRVKILFPYKSRFDKKLEKPLALYINEQIWQNDIKKLLKEITKIFSDLNIRLNFKEA